VRGRIFSVEHPSVLHPSIGLFFSDNLTKTFYDFKIIFFGHSLALWKKSMVNNALRIEETVSMTACIYISLLYDSPI
jgi:hypothetical protein